MSVLVDSNVLIDLFSRNSIWLDWSRQALKSAGDHSRLVINPIIFAEVSVKISRIEYINDALSRADFDREHVSYEAAFLAGKAFADYKSRGGARRSPLPDFFIGAHALVAGHQLLTRDAARYRTYFPSLSLIAP